MRKMYWQTMQFQLMKLLPGVCSVLFSGLLLLPVTYWSNHGLEGSGRGIVLLVWAAVSALVYYFVVHYYGYLFQVAYVAAVAEVAVNQAPPSSYRDFLKEFVKGEFVKPADYFYLHQLVKGAITELTQSSVWKNKFLLDYLSVCCVCINFYKKKAGKYKSITDAVVVYAKNQQKLLANDGKSNIIVAGCLFVGTLLFWMLYLLIPPLGWFSALVLGGLTVAVLKYAFLDSWFLMKELLVFGQLDQIAVGEAYEKLSASSRSFQKIYHKVRRERSRLDAKERPLEFDFHSLKFCGECGSLVAPEEEGIEQEEQNEDALEQKNQTDGQKEPQEVEENGEGSAQNPSESEKDEGMEAVLQSVQEVKETAGVETDSNNGTQNTDQGDGITDGGSIQEHLAGSEDHSKSGHHDRQASGATAQKVEQGVVFCGECGAAIFQKETFCGECGTPADRKNKEKFCGECGSVIIAGEKFCGECGSPA